MKKRIAAVTLCFVLTALLCSCGRYASVKVNSQKIEKGVYNYFLDRAARENPSASKEEREKAAQAMLCRYVAVNSVFNDKKLKLDSAQKTALSDAVDSNWHAFGSYYEKNGISRQDLYKIEQNKMYQQALMLNYYSESGEQPVSDETLKQYFSENYVALRTVMGFMTTVDEDNNAVAFSEEQKKAMIETFENMASSVNEGGESLLVLAAEIQNVTVTEDIVVISKDNNYPEGFYEKIREIESGKAQSFVLGDYVFTAQRYELLDEENSFFEKYRAQCLSAIKGEEFSKVVDGWAQAYAVN